MWGWPLPSEKGPPFVKGFKDLRVLWAFAYDFKDVNDLKGFTDFYLKAKARIWP